MTKQMGMDEWFEVSGLLLRELLPPGGANVYFGQNLPPAEFAELATRERQRVDHALVAMATASGQEEVKTIIDQLSVDTLIALFSRWGQYLEQWKKIQAAPDQNFWVPPKWNDIWRALFLSLTSEGIHSTAAARSLWPEVFVTE